MIRLAVTVLCGALFTLHASAQDAALDRLAAARQRWQGVAHADYGYSYQKYCECNRDIPPVTYVTIANGRIERVYHVHSDSDREVPARAGSLDLYYTIDDLFAKLETAFAGGITVRAEYDPRLGYPTSIFIDYSPTITGEELDLRQIRVELP
jgi:hypothetical protein